MLGSRPGRLSVIDKIKSLGSDHFIVLALDRQFLILATTIIVLLTPHPKNFNNQHSEFHTAYNCYGGSNTTR